MSADSEFDPLQRARCLLRTTSVGSLATLNEGGAPFASLIEVASDADGSPLTLISTLAVHTQNLQRDARASILLDERNDGGGRVLTRARISLVGRMTITTDINAAGRFLGHHPDAAMYAGFGDFAYWRLSIEQCHLVAGFGRIVDIAPEDLFVQPSPDLVEAEADITAHMNEDHGEAMALYARHYAGIEADTWSCAGVDPTGLSLLSGNRLVHIPFPEPIRHVNVLRQVLKQMAGEARHALSADNKSTN